MYQAGQKHASKRIRTTGNPRLGWLLPAVAAVLATAWPTASVLAAGPEPQSAASSTNAPDSLRDKARQLSRQGAYAEAIDLYQQLRARPGADPGVVADLAVVFAWSGQNEKAVATYEALPAGWAQPDYLIREIARAYRQCRRFEQAAEKYRLLLAGHPSDHDARLGLGWTLAEWAKPAEAEAVLKLIPPEAPQYLDSLFALAMACWNGGQHLAALRTYDRILALRPEHAAAITLKARVLSALGACSLALDFADAHRTAVGTGVRTELEINLAAARIRWNEPGRALETLDRIIAAEASPFAETRARFDRILALRRMRRMSEVQSGHQDLVEHAIAIPYWVREAAGDACLALRRPAEAARLYEEVIAEQPALLNPRMALYHVRIDEGDYAGAEELLDRLERETPDWVTDRGILRYNYQKEQVQVSRVWWMAYQNRLREAQDRLVELLAQAPANRACRSALGTILLWRGWPHAALEELEWIVAMSDIDPWLRQPHEDAPDLDALNARASALNACHLASEARDSARGLAAENPLNEHTAQLNEELRIEDSTAGRLEVVRDWEQPRTRGLRVLARVTQPLRPDLSVYVGWLSRESEDDTQSTRWNRASQGISYRLFPWLLLEQETAMNLTDSGNVGSRSCIECEISDTWSIQASRDTLNAEVPLRAAAAGIDGTETRGEIRCTASDILAVSASARLLALDDGNDRRSYGLAVRQGLYASGRWRSRMELDFAADKSSQTNVPYFSPRQCNSILLTHVLDHALYQRYERAVTHEFRAGIGVCDQADYEPGLIWDLRYQLDVRFTRRTSLLGGVSLSRRVYDGEDTDIGSVYLTCVTHL